jgi:hypothetical protein
MVGGCPAPLQHHGDLVCKVFMRIYHYQSKTAARIKHEYENRAEGRTGGVGSHQTIEQTATWKAAKLNKATLACHNSR